MIGSLIYVRVSGFYFLPVLEGKPDVVLGIDRDVVHQPVPSFQREFRQLIRQPFKGLQKGFVVGTLGLFLADLLGDFLKSSLGLVEALRQGVVPFLVFGLIQSNVGVFVNALLHLSETTCVSCRSSSCSASSAVVSKRTGIMA